MNEQHDRERDVENRDRDQKKDAPVPRRRDEAEGVPEFERGSDLDRGQEERESQR